MTLLVHMSKDETTLTALDLDESTLLAKGSLIILGGTENLEALLRSAPINGFQCQCQSELSLA
jgi:hypothetical protein